MSMSIDELTALYGTYGINGLKQNTTQSVDLTSTNTTDGDSYISTIADLSKEQAIPSENYNDLGREITSSLNSSLQSNVTENSSAASSTVLGAQGGSESSGASGGSSDSEEETETEIVTINGQTYLQTTTTDSSGNESVTRVPIG